jgi:hypothetical protein
MPNIVTGNQRPARPQLGAATEEEAITLVNRWLHREVGMALNVSCATFNPDTFCWHLPIHLAYGATGSLGIVGDVYVHAATHPESRHLGSAGLSRLKV